MARPVGCIDAVRRVGAVALVLSMLVSTNSWAAVISSMGNILSGFGGAAGYGTLAMTPNDDDSSSLLDLPFTANFYGNSYTKFYVNNNGNVSFNGPIGDFTPDAFPVANQPMIAPFWADVDTRCPTCGAVYVASPNPNTVVVTWDRVGYFQENSDKTNTFQLVLRNRSDTGAGNFDAEFRYGELSWTTGDVSGGTNGLGGIPAQAGLDAGDQVNFFTLPGSRTDAVIDLVNTSNLDPQVPGIWSLAVRNGSPPGSTPTNPLPPTNTDNGWNFNFNVGPNSRWFIDPAVAVGYDYVVNSGPNVRTVLLPDNIGDGNYDLWMYDEGLGTFVDSGTDIRGGVLHDFGPEGVRRFSVRGIELSAGLDPNDPMMFVTGLEFAGVGAVDLTMRPVVSSVVPEPGTLALLMSAMLCVAGGRRRARRDRQ